MRLCFGPFTLDLDQRRLLNAGREVPLTPKAFALLKLLIDARPRALSKDEILQAVWADTFVTENTLATTISDLREAVGDDPRAPRFIRTSYAFGYAFVGDVILEEPAPSPVAAARWTIVHAHQEIPLREGENILGRGGPGVVVIDDWTVSRHHARLTVDGGRLFCQDLGSKNGTWVKREAATTRLEVRDGDDLRLGSVVIIARIGSARESTRSVER